MESAFTSPIQVFQLNCCRILELQHFREAARTSILALSSELSRISLSMVDLSKYSVTGWALKIYSIFNTILNQWLYMMLLYKNHLLYNRSSLMYCKLFDRILATLEAVASFIINCAKNAHTTITYPTLTNNGPRYRKPSPTAVMDATLSKLRSVSPSKSSVSAHKVGKPLKGPWSKSVQKWPDSIWNAFAIPRWCCW